MVYLSQKKIFRSIISAILIVGIIPVFLFLSLFAGMPIHDFQMWKFSKSISNSPETSPDSHGHLNPNIQLVKLKPDFGLLDYGNNRCDAQVLALYKSDQSNVDFYDSADKINDQIDYPFANNEDSQFHFYVYSYEEGEIFLVIGKHKYRLVKDPEYSVYYPEPQLAIDFSLSASDYREMKSLFEENTRMEQANLVNSYVVNFFDYSFASLNDLRCI